MRVFICPLGKRRVSEVCLNSNIVLLYHTKRKLRFEALIDKKDEEEVKFVEWLKDIAKVAVEEIRPLSEVEDRTLELLLEDMKHFIWYFNVFRVEDWDKSKGDDVVRDLILKAIGEVQENLIPEGIKLPRGCLHQHEKRLEMFGEK